MTIQHTITIEVKDEKEAITARANADRMIFLGSGVDALLGYLTKHNPLVSPTVKKFTRLR